MAIALDTSADLGNTGSGTTLTTAYTVTGSNPILFVAFMSDQTSVSVTYNGVPMTQIGTDLAVAGEYISLWQLVGPATGTHNVVITVASTGFIYGVAASYTGAAQTSPIDDSGTDLEIDSNPCQVILTTTVDNDWWVAYGFSDPGGNSAGSGATLRVDSSANRRLYDSNGALTPTGDYNANVNNTGRTGIIAAAFKSDLVSPSASPSSSVSASPSASLSASPSASPSSSASLSSTPSSSLSASVSASPSSSPSPSSSISSSLSASVSASPSSSVSASPSSSLSASLSSSLSSSPSSSPSASVSSSPSSSVSASPSQADYTDQYSTQGTIYTDQYREF